MELKDWLNKEPVSELSASDICKLIQVGRKCEVEVLEFGNIKVQFRDIGKQTDIMHTKVEFGEKKIPDNAEVETVEAIAAERILLEDTVELREEQLANYVLTDPEKYEELLMQGDLEDEKPNDSGPKQDI